jgi:hypothetical protein
VTAVVVAASTAMARAIGLVEQGKGKNGRWVGGVHVGQLGSDYGSGQTYLTCAADDDQRRPDAVLSVTVAEHEI